METRPTNSLVSIADLKSRRVPVEWFETVAIVQAVCRALLESGVDPEKTALGLKNVFIDSDGSVHFPQNAGEKGEPAIRQIGELLQTSLAGSAFPVPLRLVIIQASSTPSFYASIAELSKALEYFERPDRSGLIRAVYERAQGYQPVSDVESQDPQQPEDEKPARPDKRQPRRIPRRVIVACAAAGMAIVLLLVVSRLSTAPRGSAAGADQPKKNTAGASTGIASSVSALVDRLNPFTASSSRQDPAPDNPKTIDQSPRRALATAGGSARRSSASAVQPPSVVTLRDVSYSYPPATSHDTDAITVDPAATEGTAGVAAETMIYSASDQDVTPPVAAYPQLPVAPPAGVPAENLSTLELLVSETGQVESVKLRGRPRHLGEALLVTVNLSAAKTWRFTPAVKDGRPVRYRKLVQVWLATR